MLKTESLDLGSLRVIAEASKDLKTGTELERILQEPRTRKTVYLHVNMFVLACRDVQDEEKLYEQRKASIGLESIGVQQK
jgi:N-glycosylase/DNA lyase